MRFVFRNLTFIGQESFWAAEAAECANEQGQFWEYYDKLFAEHGAENSGTFSKDNLKGFAAALGLDTEQFNQCLDSDEYLGKIRQETAEGQQKGIRSTPSLLVNGHLIDGGADYQILKTAVDAALSRAQQ